MRIKDTYENTIVIQKSIFITRIFRVDSISMVEEKLAEIRKKHYDAKHNCYAYILGDNQEIQKASDDGEPQKTAGAPMLDVLKKNNMTNILAIVTRYFGGILLGAGGLVRAYSSSVSECLKLATLYDTKLQTKFSLITSYQGYNTLLKVIPYITLEDTSFTDQVLITGSLDIDKYELFKEDLYKYKINGDTLTKLGDFQVEVPIEE
ncbi:putative YigZ family protein [Anaeroplasma bactoclasticum]|jgi:uncharacterized YigZ family protein|uniref:Putative YigZ family protein n=1 Tax=Anaeroplasma bactoclasticum TaxID=2088 RepID=A0A397S0B8_9MOLU|nr:YigZ family protein [Anaeroplasma bactoclasticum]RIA75624.1 putative YigZ family protein [Anaeroplasma bactoclasticum]